MDERWERRRFSAEAATRSKLAIAAVAFAAVGNLAAFLARTSGHPLHASWIEWGPLGLAAVLFVRWLGHTCDNAGAWTDQRLPFTPSDARWSFFIPVVNLFRPFQVMDALWKASDPSVLPVPIAAASARPDVGYRAGPDHSPVHGFPMRSPVLAWALFYLWIPLPLALVPVIRVLVLGADSLVSLLSMAMLCAVRALAAVAAIMMVRGVQLRVDERVRRIESALS